MKPKHKKNAVEETSEIITSWVKTEIPKKGQHGKKENQTRRVEKESYNKIDRKHIS